MIITNYRDLRNKALRLMKDEDHCFIGRMQDFRNTNTRKSIYLEPVRAYGSKSQLIVCGPLQRVPEQAVYTTDTTKEQSGNRRQLYLGNHSIVSQSASIPFDDDRGVMKNDAMVYIFDTLRTCAILKKVMIQDFARLCLSKWYGQEYGFFIFKTPEDKKLILGTLERMVDEIKAIESENLDSERII